MLSTTIRHTPTLQLVTYVYLLFLGNKFHSLNTFVTVLSEHVMLCLNRNKQREMCSFVRSWLSCFQGITWKQSSDSTNILRGALASQLYCLGKATSTGPRVCRETVVQQLPLRACRVECYLTTVKDHIFDHNLRWHQIFTTLSIHLCMLFKSSMCSLQVQTDTGRQISASDVSLVIIS